MDRPGLAAATGDHCRPADGGGKADPPAGPGLTHAPACAGRVETFDVVIRRPRLGAGRPAPGLVTATGVKRVTRCCDCGAHLAVWHVPLPRIEPDTPEWRWAWRWHPQLIAEQLTASERQDPELNPQHPAAVHDLQPISDLTRLLAEQRARGPRYPHMA